MTILDSSNTATNQELLPPLNALLSATRKPDESKTEFPEINDTSTSDIIIKIEPHGPLVFSHRHVLESNSFFASLQQFKEWKTGLIHIHMEFYTVSNIYTNPRRKSRRFLRSLTLTICLLLLAILLLRF